MARTQAPAGMTRGLPAPQNKGADSGQPPDRGRRVPGLAINSSCGSLLGCSLVSVRAGHTVPFVPQPGSSSQRPPWSWQGSVWCSRLAPARALLLCLDLFFG